jgi:hypothetical protein
MVFTPAEVSCTGGEKVFTLAEVFSTGAEVISTPAEVTCTGAERLFIGLPVNSNHVKKGGSNRAALFSSFRKKLSMPQLS